MSEIPGRTRQGSSSTRPLTLSSTRVSTRSTATWACNSTNTPRPIAARSPRLAWTIGTTIGRSPAPRSRSTPPPAATSCDQRGDSRVTAPSSARTLAPASRAAPGARLDPDALLRAANQARRARQFAEADRLYRDLQARFPDTRAARTSHVPHARLLLDTLGRPADALAGFGPDAVDPVAEQLADPHPSVREHAAEILGLVGDPSGVGPLVAALADPDAGVRFAALLALGHLGSPDADPAADALTRLASDADAHVALAAVSALGQLDTDEAGRAIEGVVGSPDERARLLAERLVSDRRAGGPPAG